MAVKSEQVNGAVPFQVKAKGEGGKGESNLTGDTAPRLPHERDESQDSQAEGGDAVRDDIKQAFDDVMSGQMDTDLREQRGVEQTVPKQSGSASEQMRKDLPSKAPHKQESVDKER